MKLPLFTRSTDIRTLALGQGCEGQWLLSNLLDDELPTTTWFALGTALHEGYELAMLGELETPEELTRYVRDEIRAVKQTEPDMIESASKRAKRSKATMLDDGLRMARKWWNDVHPESDERNKIFDAYKWPPTVEHNIALVDEELYTQVDAIFESNGNARFGAETMIVDWKTGSTAKAAKAQLDTYAYGGRKEGWFGIEQVELGFFWHVDHSKPQREYEYIGDTVVEAWIEATSEAKRRILEHPVPIYRPDWWCNYCRAKSVCPVQGGSLTHEDVSSMIETAIIIDHPEEEE